MHPGVQHALFVFALYAALASGRARGDVFLLHNGGQVQGEWLNRKESSAKVYVIRTLAGGQLTLAKDGVAEVITERPELAEYRRLAPTFRDTIDEQWKLAEWCRERNLRKEREIHLRRVLEIDPDHVKARLALGYMHRGGQWTTREERLQKQGYQYYRGRWRLVQEIELLESRDTRHQAENEWRARLHRLSEALPGDASGKAYRQIAAIRDPRAVPALSDRLARDRLRPARLLYVEVLGAIASAEAVAVLVRVSVDDRDEEIRIASLEEIVRLKPPGVADSYIRLLKDNNNHRVNRAAFALAQLGDRTAIEPLIEALITVHAQVVRSGGASDAVTTTFSQDSAGGSGSGFVAGGRTDVVRLPVQNHQVLTALTHLAGGPSFGFNQDAWRNWCALEKSRRESINARRDSGQ